MARVQFFLLLSVVLVGISSIADCQDIFPYQFHPSRYHVSLPQNFHPSMSGLWRIDSTNPRDAFSCRRKCGLRLNPHLLCQCDSSCEELDNCCPDFDALCVTCAGRCKSPYAKYAPCQCNKKCHEYNNCCPDLEEKCFGTLADVNPFIDSCVGRCDRVDHSKTCQCNDQCERFGDCCSDYANACLQSPTSCVGRCAERYNSKNPCHCNTECSRYGNCCADYNKQCNKGPAPAVVTDATLAALSEELFALDVDNNVAAFLSSNKQGVSIKDGVDRAPQPLLKVNPAVYDKPTVAKLRKLLDNYVPEVGVNEDDTPEEQQEVNEFLDAVLATPIMIRTAAFLAETGYIPSNFRQTIHKIWFGHYSRGNNALGSTGFEHVFLGELKNGVSGFHHWAFWAQEEQNQDLNYKGYIEEYNFGSKGTALSVSFEWRNAEKPISSLFLGPSPEFELAIYTICFYTRRGKLCPTVLNGEKVPIQTYDIIYKGETYVASAFPQ